MATDINIIVINGFILPTKMKHVESAKQESSHKPSNSMTPKYLKPPVN